MPVVQPESRKPQAATLGLGDHEMLKQPVFAQRPDHDRIVLPRRATKGVGGRQLVPVQIDRACPSPAALGGGRGRPDGRLIGMIGDDEIYRGILRQAGVAERRA
jgi:hypothetical protein